MKTHKPANRHFFDKFSTRVTILSGKPVTFIIACIIVLIWATTGPVFHYSETWQLIINTGTTIITFLMVFLIQQAQNKDTMAIHLKLNELIAANKMASNRLIDIEDLSSEELQILKNFYIKLSELSKKEKDIFATHSVDEAQVNQATKISIINDEK